MNITEKLFPTFPTHFGTGTHTHSFRMTNEKRDSLFHHIRGTFQNFRVKMRKHVPFAVNTVFLEFDELEEATLKVGKGGGEKVVSTPSVQASEARGTLTVP